MSILGVAAVEHGADLAVGDGFEGYVRADDLAPRRDEHVDDWTVLVYDSLDVGPSVSIGLKRCTQR
jgi:hypothetical protein